MLRLNANVCSDDVIGLDVSVGLGHRNFVVVHASGMSGDLSPWWVAVMLGRSSTEAIGHLV